MSAGRHGRPPAPAASSKKTDRPDAVAQFVGAIARAAVAAGEPIRDSKVVIAKGSGFMVAILPHGMRAVSMDVSPETEAGGFILPNDHVDVLLTHRDKVAEKTSGVEKMISEAITPSTPYASVFGHRPIAGGQQQ